MKTYLNERIEHLVGKMKCTVCIYNYYSNSGATRNKCIFIEYTYSNDYHGKIFNDNLTVEVGPLNDRTIKNNLQLKKDVTILFLKQSKAVLSLIDKNKQNAIDALKNMVEKRSEDQKWWLEIGQFMNNEELEDMP